SSSSTNHLDPNTKLASIIPSLQLQPIIHTSNVIAFVTIHATTFAPVDADATGSAVRQHMVKNINAISGGSNEPVHETKRQRKEYFRTVSHVSEGKCFRTPWSHVPITF